MKVGIPTPTALHSDEDTNPIPKHYKLSIQPPTSVWEAPNSPPACIPVKIPNPPNSHTSRWKTQSPPNSTPKNHQWTTVHVLWQVGNADVLPEPHLKKNPQIAQSSHPHECPQSHPLRILHPANPYPDANPNSTLKFYNPPKSSPVVGENPKSSPTPQTSILMNTPN